jgi:molecular chaperone DnaK
MATDPGGLKRHALGVDFGTSNTVAVARWPDGRARPILVDGSPLLPSAVYAESGGTLAVGRDAVHSARLDPARFEPNPKRRIDDDLVLLGEQEFPVVDLIAAVLARVAEEWHRAVGPVRPEVTLTCPATWGAARRTLLAEAARRAGLGNARLVAEPVAAATYFADILGRDVPIGSVVVVHDFGAGTFDASVVARNAGGFEVMAVDGRDDIGGLDVDAAIVEHLKTDEWQRILEPATVEERRARRQLWDDVRIAKERLSRAQSADFVVPLLDTEVRLTRDELEKLARPVLDQTVRVTKKLIEWADLPEGRLAGVFLVGGASRIPLVATLLHRELGEAPVVIEQPELVVAEGSILADAALLTTGPASPGPTAELRLVSHGRPEAETVRVAKIIPRVPGTTGLQPAVDPWPDADHGHWVPDPQATVATAKPRFDGAPAVPNNPPTRDTRAMSPVKAISRPVSPPAPATPARTRPMTQHPVTDRPMIDRPVTDRPVTQRPVNLRPSAPSKRRPRRRRGRFLRFLQILLSIIVMIVVPLVALVVAYGYGNAEPLSVDAKNLVKDLAGLLGIRV